MSLTDSSLMVWGHRGHRHHRFSGQYGYAPTPPHENSLKAYEQVLKVTGGLECDVVKSKQNTPFLVHDTLFNGITKYQLKNQLDEASKDILKERYIFQLEDEEVEDLKLRDGQDIPKLQELMGLMPDYEGRYLNLELKGPNVAGSTVHLVEKAIRQKLIQPEQVIFSSYNLPALHMLRLNAGPRFKISVMLTPSDLAMAQMYPNWPSAEQNAYYVPFSSTALERSDIQEIQPDFLNIEASQLKPSDLTQIYKSYPDIKLILWRAGEMHPSEDESFVETIQAFEESKRVFAVVSDFPEALQQSLVKKGIKVKVPPPNPYSL
jgi:glycerophosphoryl diester phosphodiesterase